MIDKIADRYAHELRKAWIDIVPEPYRDKVWDLMLSVFQGQYLRQQVVEEEADAAHADLKNFRALAGESLRLYRHLLNDCVQYLNQRGGII
jgi:hypothetical protein